MKIPLIVSALISLSQAACPNWIGQPEPYAVGSIVTKDSKNYEVIRTLDNGWIEPSNTWFWAITTKDCNSAPPVTLESVLARQDSILNVLANVQQKYLQILSQNPELGVKYQSIRTDHQVYKTVRIGNQTWIAENMNKPDMRLLKQVGSFEWSRDYINHIVSLLTIHPNRVEPFNHPHPRSTVTILEANGGMVGGTYVGIEFMPELNWSQAAVISDFNTYCLNYLESNCSTFGRKYVHRDFALANVCPTGYHIPSDEEWMELETYVKQFVPESEMGRALAANSHLWNTSVKGTNQFGFSAIPADNNGDMTTSWLSSSQENDQSIIRTLSFSEGSYTWTRGTHSGTYLSVRCVRAETN